MFAPISCHLRRHLGIALCAVSTGLLAARVSAADVPAGLAGSGVTIIPADAAFLSATLRAREQFDRFLKSNAYAALRRLPTVKRAFDSLEEQRTMPGNPLSMVDTFLQLPENAEAAELLADMVATDTFVYGEPSCVAFAKLLRRLAAVAQAAGNAYGGAPVIIEEELEIFEEDDGDEAAGRPRRQTLRCQVERQEMHELSPDVLQGRLLVQTLVDNLDLLVVPDVVWGFRTTKVAAAKAQLARLETLTKAVAAGNQGMAEAVARRQIAGGDFLEITLRGDMLPWEELRRGLEDDAGDIDGFDGLFDRLRKLDLSLALGVMGDRVILSVGDSAEHLVKLAAGPGKALVSTPAFAPLLEHADKPLTGISYLSADMAAVLVQSPEDAKQQMEMLEQWLDAAGFGEDFVEDVQGVFERFSAALARQLPEPGSWTAFSFLTESGYEGYAWDRSRNQPLDGTRRLDLLEHAGGAPLAVVVSRVKSDPRIIDDVAALVGGLWSVFEEHGLPAFDDEAEEQVEDLADRFAPLVRRLGEIVRDKFVPALADGQMGLVIDGKARTKKPHRDLPASADPLPIPESAIVLHVKDAKLFREGLSDLFALGDDVVAALREIDPDALRRDYRVPDPQKEKVAAGTVWSFALPESGLDEQMRPAIGVGDDVAVFALAPKQAARLLGSTRLETGAQLSTFEEPLAGATAFDVAGLVEAVKPWLVYMTRYGFVRERDGAAPAADEEIGADDETDQARDALAVLDVVLEVAGCLRAAVAETSFRDDALVTHWRNVIRDLPRKP